MTQRWQEENATPQTAKREMAAHTTMTNQKNFQIKGPSAPPNTQKMHGRAARRIFVLHAGCGHILGWVLPVSMLLLDWRSFSLVRVQLMVLLVFVGLSDLLGCVPCNCNCIAAERQKMATTAIPALTQTPEFAECNLNCLSLLGLAQNYLRIAVAALAEKDIRRHTPK